MPYKDVTCPGKCGGSGWVTTETTTNRPETCPRCGGSKHEPDDVSAGCRECRATGVISVPHTTTSRDRCTTCDGKGTISVIDD